MSLFSFIGPALQLGASILGGNAAKKSADKAGQLQYQASRDAIAAQERRDATMRADYEPWRLAGAEALEKQGDILGLNGSGISAEAINALRESPFYRSLYENGEEALLQTASATGGLRGGNVQRGLADFGADTLATTIERMLSQLGGISGRGQQVVGEISQLGQLGTNNVMQQLGAGGSARAGAELARGGIQAGIWNNVGNFLSQFAPKAAGWF
jgi:hypothetical protein